MRARKTGIFFFIIKNIIIIARKNALAGDPTRRRAVLQDHDLRRLFLRLDHGRQRERVRGRVVVRLGSRPVAGVSRLGENGLGVCSSQSKRVESVRGRRRRFRFDESFEEVRDGRETRVRVDRVEVVHRGEFWMDFNHFGFARRVRVFGFVREVSAVEEHFVAR